MLLRILAYKISLPNSQQYNNLMDQCLFLELPKYFDFSAFERHFLGVQ